MRADSKIIRIIFLKNVQNKIDLIFTTRLTYSIYLFDHKITKEDGKIPMGSENIYKKARKSPDVFSWQGL